MSDAGILRVGDLREFIQKENLDDHTEVIFLDGSGEEVLLAANPLSVDEDDKLVIAANGDEPDSPAVVSDEDEDLDD